MAKGFDTRRLCTGKDGKLFITVGTESQWYASVEEFDISGNFSTTDVQPAGDWQQYGVPTGVKFTLKFTEMVVRDDLMLESLLDAIKNGKVPTFDFQGSITVPYDDSQEVVNCDECIPDGDFNIMSISSGDIVKRDFSFIINSVPDLIKSLAA